MIKLISNDKKRYMDLLLLADEQESMINKYLDRGEMFALFDNGLKSICVVTDEGDRVCEIKNIATEPNYQGMGYGRKLIDYICEHYSLNFDSVIVGTGDSPLTIPFYKRCGFIESHRVENFFVDNYDHPIFECGKQLIDMVYLKKNI